MTEDTRSIEALERVMREWLTTTTLTPNMLSRIKSRRDPDLLMKFNALALDKMTKEQADKEIDALLLIAFGEPQ